MSKKKYTEKDLADFGNYLLSKERKKLVKQAGNGGFKTVSHADVSNWKEKQST